METTLKWLKVGGWMFEYVIYGSFTLVAFAIAAEATAAFEAMRNVGL